jgi:hypothetical protein
MFIIATIIVAGIVGGLAGHLANLFPEPTPPKSLGAQLSKAVEGSLVDILIGIIAALCVPAIISSTPSTLMSKLVSDNKWADINLLYLAGYCLIAAYSARTFLQSMLGKIGTNALQSRLLNAESRIDALERRLNQPVPPDAQK